MDVTSPASENILAHFANGGIPCHNTGPSTMEGVGRKNAETNYPFNQGDSIDGRESEDPRSAE